MNEIATRVVHSALTPIDQTLAAQGRTLDEVLARLRGQRIETPSWGYGNSGTRFRVFPQPGVPRSVAEKLEDAAMVQRLTGVAPAVALHIPWDRVDDFQQLRQVAAGHGLALGAINPNLFQQEAYKLGSLAHPHADVRAQAVDHVRECIEIAAHTGSRDISLWLADGTNYAGQDDLRERRRRLLASLQQIYAALAPGMRLLIEYKFYEPAFYSTDIADWGMALTLCQRLGPQAQVLVDLGHHAQGANIEQIVSLLLLEGRLGGFHFNGRKYGDDDLIVGSTNPLELFLIYNELASAEADDDAAVREGAHNVAYMIDQSHNVEAKIPAMILSIMNCQTAYARALLVDRQALRAAQQAGDVIAAHRVLMQAYETDVRPLLARLRGEMGLAPDPLQAYDESGYQQRVERERLGGTQMSW
ncbi:MAG TPA: L-rhamnose isomerase [Chloroflexota bacterium]|nr:L-rhamnose isomerase [Chloroflexota bacterium]